MGSFDYLIVGAGLFGSTIAQRLTELGNKCLVIEKESHVGGMCKTSEANGIQIHEFGPHIFHTSNECVWEYITRFANMIPFRNSPIANYNDKLYTLPFNLQTFNQVYGVNTPAEMEALRASFPTYNGNPKNLEEQAISLVGERAYEILIKGYSEKQWGRPCDQLPASLMKRLPVRNTFDNNYFNDKYQGIPQEGYTKMCQNMLKGVQVELNTRFNHKMAKYGNKIICTAPIDEYFDSTYGKLSYVGRRFEHTVRAAEHNMQGVAVMNYTSKNVNHLRSIEHKHFLPGQEGHATIMTKEYSTFNDPDSRFYPVESEQNLELLKKYDRLQNSIDGVCFGGRLGTFKYLNMDQVILQAIRMSYILMLDRI